MQSISNTSYVDGGRMSEKITGKIIASSPKAVLLETETGEKWIPFYSLWWPKHYTVSICISDKMAKEKGFITEEEYEERAGVRDRERTGQESPTQSRPDQDNSTRENLPF